jgi:hypothetical protein
MQVLISLLIAMFGAVPQSSTPSEADEILTQLSKIRLDKKQIYNIHDITLRRDVLSIALNRGTIAFLEPAMGKVTGAVFIGSGELLAIPPDALEKQQVYRFTGSPVLTETFQTAILRFSDGTYDEIRREISQHAEEEVVSDAAAPFDVWDQVLAGRAKQLNLRFLADFLEPPGKPFFLAELKGDKTGWFSVGFDPRALEEVSAFQVHESGTGSVADIWASFNQRSEARNPEAVAHKSKSPADIVSYDIDGTSGSGNKIDVKATMRLTGRTEGARLLNFALSPLLHMTSVQSDTDEPMPFYQYQGESVVSIVLPRPLKAGQEFTLRVSYAGDAGKPWYPSQNSQTVPAFKSTLPLAADPPGQVLSYMDKKVIPASYHDQWLFEALPRYLDAMKLEAVPKVLQDTREDLKPIESAGPIWLGPRLASSVTPAGYRAVFDKGLWVIHMLRAMLGMKFQPMLTEFVNTYNGKAASTWDFKHLAEKYADSKLDWFFDEWVFGTGVPVYSLDYKIQASGNAFVVEGTVKQSGVPGGFTMPVPVYADSEFLGRVQASEGEGEFRFRVTKKPERVLIDPHNEVLTY